MSVTVEEETGWRLTLTSCTTGGSSSIIITGKKNDQFCYIDGNRYDVADLSLAVRKVRVLTNYTPKRGEAD